MGIHGWWNLFVGAIFTNPFSNCFKGYPADPKVQNSLKLTVFDEGSYKGAMIFVSFKEGMLQPLSSFLYPGHFAKGLEKTDEGRNILGNSMTIQDGKTRELSPGLGRHSKESARNSKKKTSWIENKIYLVVSTHLKNMSQNGNLPQMGVKIETTT